MLKWGLSERGSNLLKSDRPLTSTNFPRVHPNRHYTPPLPPGSQSWLMSTRQSSLSSPLLSRIPLFGARPTWPNTRWPNTRGAWPVACKSMCKRLKAVAVLVRVVSSDICIVCQTQRESRDTRDKPRIPVARTAFCSSKQIGKETKKANECN